MFKNLGRCLVQKKHRRILQASPPNWSPLAHARLQSQSSADPENGCATGGTPAANFGPFGRLSAGPWKGKQAFSRKHAESDSHSPVATGTIEIFQATAIRTMVYPGALIPSFDCLTSSNRTTFQPESMRSRRSPSWPSCCLPRNAVKYVGQCLV